VSGQGDPGRDLQGQEHGDGEQAEADADLPGQRRPGGGVQPAPQDGQDQQAEQELAPDPGHGRQDVDEPNQRPDGDDARLLR
jgi:hypothetical protein